MKKIIFLLVIMLINILFAENNWLGYVFKCEQASTTEKALKTATVDNCLKAINILKSKKNRNIFQTEALGESYYNAAVIYEYSPKYNHNYRKAVEMLRKAIEVNYDKYGKGAPSLKLGTFYVLGYGVNKNYIQAYKFLKRAAEYDNSGAQKLLEILCNRIAPWACK